MFFSAPSFRLPFPVLLGIGGGILLGSGTVPSALVPAALVPAAMAQSVTAANDSVGTVVTPNGQRFDITAGQRSGDGQNLFHSFEQFGLTQEQMANFIADPSIRNILSRVVGEDASVINGLIRVTGAEANLYLMNPAGVFFGDGARLDVPASFTATTATGIGFEGGWFDAVGDNAYGGLNGDPQQFVFNVDTPGSVFNAGELAVGTGQTLTLLGGTVTSVGRISSDGGNIFLAAVPGQSVVTLRPASHVLGLDIDIAPLDPAVITDSGLSQWTVPVTQMPDLLTGGTLSHADTVVVNADGTIALQSGLPIQTAPGSVNVAGQLDASAVDQTGGWIGIGGQEIGVLEADIQADGASGGGTVWVGGELRGGDRFPTSDRTYVSSNSQITANSTQRGDGGEVVVYGDTTGFFGEALAQGGPLAGNGGFVEVSGLTNLVLQGAMDVTAANGSPGTVLIDPTNIAIVGRARDPVADGPNTFTGELAALDNPGGTTTLFQSDVEAIAGNILLEATNNILIEALDQGRLVFSPSGENITFRADADGNGQGGFSMVPTDTLFTNGRNLFIEGATIELGNINTLLLGDVAGNPDDLTAGLLALLGDETFELLGGFDAEGNQLLNDVVRGDVRLTATGAINAGNINTQIPQEFQDALALFGELGVFAVIDPNDDGTVEIRSTNDVVNAGVINTSSPAVGGSDVIVEAAADAVIESVDTSAIDEFFSFFNVEEGGDVSITGDRIRITGANENGDSITTEGFNDQFFTETPINPEFPENEVTIENLSGQVNIVHRGGPDNVPFIIGNAAIDNVTENGTAGAINTGDNVGAVATAGTFNVVTADPGVIAANSDRTVITSINSAPVLTGNIAATTEANMSVTLPLASAVVTDADADNTTLRIASIQAGAQITRNNEPLAVGDVVSVDDVLTYTPPASVTGDVNVLTLVASDRVADSNVIPLTVTINAPDPDPGPNPDPDPGPAEPPVTDVGTPPNNTDDDPTIVGPGVIPPRVQVLQPRVVDRVRREIDAPETLPLVPPVEFFTVQPGSSVEENTYISAIERSLYNDFASYLNLDVSENDPDLIGVSAARRIAQNIERATGERPGFIYVSFLPPDVDKVLELDRYEPQPTDELEIVVITKGGMVRRRVPGVTRAQVVGTAQQLRQDITAPTRNATRHLAEAQQLYQWLVTPIQDQLDLYGITNVSFLAEEGLRSLPFGALHDGTGYIVENYSVGLMPSLSLTDTEYVDVRNASMLAMGVSESTGGQEPLPAVPTELSTLIFDVWKGELFLNERATVDTLKGVRERVPYGIIHMATHARFEDGPYDDSYIQLWEDQLNMEEVRALGWNNPAVEMLVLSACQTAVGSRDAELGFAGLAVQTGVKTAIASLWSVDDTATMSLMSQFYSTLNTAPIKSEALRQAQLALIQGNVRVEEGVLFIPGLDEGIALPPESVATAAADLSHPYFWSAFTIVGNPW